jgi:hypothetical protein
MAITVESTIVDSASVYRLRVTLTSVTVIADPVAYVSQPAIWTEILAKAGLPTLLFVSATQYTQGYIGVERYYTLDVTFDSTHVLSTGHRHDYATLSLPLRESYRDGPYIDLDASIGPVEIRSNLTPAIDYFRITLTGAAAPYFLVNSVGNLQLDGHIRFWTDASKDIGSVDGGATMRRPRDIFVGRDVQAARNVSGAGFGRFGADVRGTHFIFIPQAVNPETSAGVRHIYWNSTDNKLYAWDGSAEHALW